MVKAEKQLRLCLLKVDTVEDNAWMSQPEAAHQLGVTLARLGMLIADGHPDTGAEPGRQAGVTIASVQAEETWRANATIRAPTPASRGPRPHRQDDDHLQAPA
ncbi:hypothetical protein [Streptomyces sp. NBC_01481]|uniref:hypothetical protein n=1 Tax=Streptomyces sp. NBC_01481 TaxID=2975869 RepID=UPI0022563224|nr:hypothetical protein [Streptomyces sp. NBC_01481]MCX4583773.1 hypothetical protein [Streptomyces sp. NBC_01481]